MNDLDTLRMWLAANHVQWEKSVRRQPNRNHAIAALAAAIAYLKAQPLADEPGSELLLRPSTEPPCSTGHVPGPKKPILSTAWGPQQIDRGRRRQKGSSK